MSKQNFSNNIIRFGILVLGLPLSLLSMFIRADDRTVVLNSFLNKSFDSNSKFLFLWLRRNRPDLKVYFVINDKKKAGDLQSTYPGAIIDTRTIRGILKALQAGTWFLSHMELPLGGCFHARRRKVVYLGHGAPLKNIGLLERNIGRAKRAYYRIQKTNISHALSTSEFYRPIISRFLGISEKRILISPQPRKEGLKYNGTKPTILGIPFAEHAVLYAPTWRPYANTQLFPFQDFKLEKLEDLLAREGIHIYVRTHPRIQNNLPERLFRSRWIHDYSEQVCPEIMDSLSVFDQLITDYSSIYFDFLGLDRPILFVPYDRDRYEREIGFVFNYGDLTPGYYCQSWEDMSRALTEYLQNPTLHGAQRRKVDKIVNGAQGEGSRVLVEMLTETGMLPRGGAC